MCFFHHFSLDVKLRSIAGLITIMSKRTLIPESLPNVSGNSVARTAQVLCLSAGLLLSNASYAQTPNDIEAARRQAEILQRQDQERLQRDQEEMRRRTERVEGIDTQVLQPKISVPDFGEQCREISEIVINNAPHLPAVARARITEKFTGRCLSAGDMVPILSEITEDYIERGYIAVRAYLEPQDLSKGRLQILVVEGIVDKIVIDDRQANSVSIRNVFPGIEGKLLNLRDLEQGIDQINRLSSNNAKLDIQPGKEPGTSTVVVRNESGNPYHFIASYDNQGFASTGKKQLGLSVGADNLLGFNDMFFLTHRESLPGDISRKYSGSDSLNFSVPFGHSTLSMGTSRSKYVSTILLPSGLELVSNGNTGVNNVRLDRVLFRDHSTRASVAATLSTKKSKSYLDGQFLSVGSRNLTLLDIDGNFNTAFLGGVLSLDLGYTQGLDALGALSDADFLPDSEPHAQFGKLKYGFYYAIPFKLWGTDASFSSQLTGQKSRNLLFGSEQISIGGLYSVRGFVGNTLLGDDGYYVRNELSVRQPFVIGNETVSSRIYLGYDAGAVKNRVPNIPEGHMTGMVVGVSVNLRGVTLDLFNTRPLTLPGFMNKESNQTWFRLTYSL